MGKLHLREYRVALAALFMVVGQFIFGALAFAEHTTVDVIVTFSPTEISSEPEIVNGAIRISTSEKSSAISALSPALSFTHQERDRLSPEFSLAGPWQVNVLTSQDPLALLAALQADPRIASAQLPGVELAGERPIAWFPDPSRDLFCLSQPQLHRSVVGAPQLENDNCVEMQTATDHDMDLPQAWGISKGDTSVVVAIIDTGFDLYHPDLGGPGPGFAVEDSLLHYNQGVWFRNWNEQPGDANLDGRPGVADANDDPLHDDYIDEDCWGNLPGDTAENDVSIGTWTALGLYTIEDAAANWTPGALFGQMVTLTKGPTYETSAAYEVITGNTATTITTSGENLLDILISRGRPGWASFSDPDRYPGSIAYKIGNGIDSDLDGKNDDIGYVGCPDDDDENGYEDDFRGWDFFDSRRALSSRFVGCEKEDYVDQDNDPRSFYDHGTAVASQIASAASSGRMMGIAPNVRILPLRAGAQYHCGDADTSTASVPRAAIRYAVDMGADVISLSFEPNILPWDAINYAVNSGVVVVIAAGNDVKQPSLAVTPANPVIFVGGLNAQDVRWFENVDYQSNHGPWVDVSALSQGVAGAVWGVMPHHSEGGGLPVPWLPPEEWHGYVYNPGGGGETHTAGGWGGTSMATPMVAGVAALVRSVYRSWSADEVINKVKTSTDNIYGAGLNDPEVTWLGTGRVNAYKALTFYGNVAALGDTTWAHNIWIGGDARVPEGNTLTIAAGDTVRVAIDDLMSAGANPNEIEFVIEGELQINGTPSAPVVFESFGETHQRWIYVESTNLAGSTFTIGGIAQIAAAAHSPLMSGVGTVSQVFAVKVSAAAALDSVTLDLSTLGGSSIVRLYDNGQGEDLDASDGIYTSEPFAAMLTAGSGQSADVTAYVMGGGYTRRSVEIEVQAISAKFTDVSSQTGLNYQGMPYSAAGGKLNVAGTEGLFVSISDAPSSVHRFVQVLPSGASYFTLHGFPVPVDGARGVSFADYDNDGDEDLFVTHAQTPKLYRNDAGTFVDATSTMGLATLAAGSTAACWGDYDNDGWLDLFVTRASALSTEPPDVFNIVGEENRLFRNTIGSGGGFVDVTSSSNLVGHMVGGASVAASWGDLDNDGDLDLAVLSLAEPPYNEVLLFVNQGDGSFVDEFMTRMFYVGSSVYYGTGVNWADMNNDGHLDLVVSCSGAGSGIHLNDGAGSFPGNQFVLLPPRVAAAGTAYSGLQVFDHNLDGYQDVLLVSANQNMPTRLFLGQPTATGVEYVENTHNAGLSHTARGMGSLAADFTSDGDVDLFVGRPVADGEFFYKTDDQNGSSALGQQYVKLRLESPLSDGVNRQGIGAAVTLTAGSLVQMQMVDGGSGRGGQQDRTLTFGLGDYTGPVMATVRWPGGVVQSDITLIASSGGTGETINLISDAAPVISNVNVATLIVPGTTYFDWVFSWDTDVACKTVNDVLTIDQEGIATPCWPGWTTVGPGAGTPYVYEAKAGGGYTHKLLLNNYDCILNCSFRYTVTSDSGLQSTTSPTKTKKVKFCASGF